MSELHRLIAEGRIEASAARSMLRQGYTPAQIVRSITVPVFA